MGVKNYLIEGVSCTGKTTVAEELRWRGYHVVHGDQELAYLGDPQTGERLDSCADGSDSVNWRHEHHIWDVEKVKSLLADRRHARSFFCGGSRNFRHFIYRFDAVFILDIDVGTLNRRLALRPADQFGGNESERALIARLHETKEDIPNDAVNIDATAPIARVVEEILLKCKT